MSETREHPRYAIELDAEVRHPSGKLPARTRDVSRGGMCFIAAGALALGGEVTLNLALVFDEATFSEPLELRARVVWCTPLGEARWQIGTSFIGMTAERRAYLDMFLRYLREGMARQEEIAAEQDDGDDSADDDEDDTSKNGFDA